MLNKERPKIEYMPYNSLYKTAENANQSQKAAQWLPVDRMKTVTDYNMSRGNF